MRTPPSMLTRRSLLKRLGAAPLGLSPASASFAQSRAADGPSGEANAGSSSTLQLACDLGAASVPLHHPWRHCVGSDHAAMALRADWQQQLSRARRELGFRHVRFHGLLCDDMGTLVEHAGRLLDSFFNADRIADFLLSIGMRPLVELSFMPEALASGGSTVFHYRGNVTPPRRIEDWSALVGRLLHHWCERYGVDEVSQWPLEVWNEPNLQAFWTGSREAYFELYAATWQAAKAVSPRLQVGGPATAANGWLPEFDAFCRARGCAPDFISTHYYPTDAFGAEYSDTVSQLAAAPLDVMRTRALEARRVAGPRPLYYTEWNITSNPRDPMHDGPFCAALAARFMLSVDGVADGFSWWTFSDLFEENYFPSLPYHGGFGLLGLHGVPKPVYRGFQLVSQLGERHWPLDGTHATAHPTVSAAVGASPAQPGAADDTTVLLLNVAMPRHRVSNERIAFALRHADGRRARAVSVTRIDAAHANPRAAWEALGRPEYLDAGAVAALESASALVAEPLAFEGGDGFTRFTLELPPDATALVRVAWDHA